VGERVGVAVNETVASGVAVDVGVSVSVGAALGSTIGVTVAALGTTVGKITAATNVGGGNGLSRPYGFMAMFTPHPNERVDRPRNTTAKKLNNLA
jgi:hypothetical protein